jgi:hypothetical protein
VRSLALLLTVVFAAAPDGPVVRTFDEDPIGAAPPGFVFAETRQAPPAQWAVERDGQGNVLVHNGVGGSGGFAVAILDQNPIDEVEVAARMKLVGGDQAAGLVWRYQDPNNYYLARLRLGRQSIDVYRLVNGNRVRVEGEDDLELDPAAWHTLKVVQGRERARVYLGGIKVFEFRSRALREPGRAGVWSAGASTAWFDDLRVSPRGD